MPIDKQEGSETWVVFAVFSTLTGDTMHETDSCIEYVRYRHEPHVW